MISSILSRYSIIKEAIIMFSVSTRNQLSAGAEYANCCLASFELLVQLFMTNKKSKCKRNKFYFLFTQNLRWLWTSYTEFFLNFVKSCISSCLSKFYDKKKFHRAVFEI